MCRLMANHKSAQKRSRQTIKRNEVNTQFLTQIKTNINKFNELIKSKNKEDLDKSLSIVNSSLAKALKKGALKKEYVSRKLSSLSKKIKNI
jgi:small subunit ribosomal protein S20